MGTFGPYRPPLPGFLAVTRRDLHARLARRFKAAGVDAPRRSAGWLLEEALGLSGTELLTGGGEPVTPEAQARAEAMAARREAGEPLQYVIGHADFFGLRLDVSPAVLIPRPETEEVAEAALEALDGTDAPWVLDVGTGSGALALALAHARPDAHVVAADVSEEALAVAASNAQRLGLAVTFVCADALRPQFADAVPPLFDLIVSNPPYVPERERPGMQREVRDHEPGTALFVPDADPLVFYRALAGHALRLLAPGGALVVETHTDHGRAVRDLFESAGLAHADLLQDLSARDRIVRARQPA